MGGSGHSFEYLQQVYVSFFSLKRLNINFKINDLAYFLNESLRKLIKLAVAIDRVGHIAWLGPIISLIPRIEHQVVCLRLDLLVDMQQVDEFAILLVQFVLIRLRNFCHIVERC